MRKLSVYALCVYALSLSACGGGEGGNPAQRAASGDASLPDAAGGGAPASPAGAASAPPSGAGPTTPLSLAAQVGGQLFFDVNLSGNRNMSCATCHSPQYGYGPPDSLAVQLGSDGVSAGVRAVPSLRYKDMTPAYSDDSMNPDGVSQNAPGGGFMWDGRADTLADQAALPLLNPLEMNNASKAAVVQKVRDAPYAALFEQAFGTGVFGDADIAFSDIGTALQAYQSEEPSFHPYSSKFDLYLGNKIGGTLTAAEMRGLALFNGEANCAACHYGGANFNGTVALMTDFTYQALGVPRNDTTIPGNPSPIPANNTASYFDMGLCGPYRTDHAPASAGAANAYCGLFKVPTLRNVATRGAFFHNGVFHSLQQVLHFYNTRDTNPEYWYPSSGGDSGNVTQNPGYALFPTYASGATVSTFNDLPAAYHGNVDEEAPMGTGIGGTNTLGSGTKPRPVHSAPVMSERDMQDVICFLNTLTDGYQPPATQPASGACVD